MATTTNFGWETPDDTDLVKDGAAAMRTLGNSIDTSFVDLKGGTTGQVLAKASGTDLDFSWVAQDDSNAIQNAIVDAKGDLIAATAADTPARLAVGTNGQVLTADSTTATGLKWATAASGAGITFITRSTFSNTASVNIDVFDNTYETYFMVIENIHAATAADDILICGRYSTTTHTGADYYAANFSGQFSSSSMSFNNTNAGTSFIVIPKTNSNYPAQAFLYFNDVGDASKYMAIAGQWATREEMFTGTIGGEIFNQQTWSGIQIKSSSSNITGAISMYGLAKA